jgi:hypothetical protein
LPLYTSICLSIHPSICQFGCLSVSVSVYCLTSTLRSVSKCYCIIHNLDNQGMQVAFPVGGRDIRIEVFPARVRRLWEYVLKQAKHYLEIFIQT